MKSSILAMSLVLASGSAAFSASAVNQDAETRTLTVTEGGKQSQVAVPAGQSVQFCPSGCFVTMPDGDRQALTGSETVEISGGKGRIR